MAAARAGAAVQLVAALGTDAAAEQLRAHLRDNEVGLDGVVSLPGSSGSAVIIVDSAAENTIVVAPGANAHLSMTSADIRAVIADSDVVLLQLEIPIATAVAAARVARAAGAVVIAQRVTGGRRTPPPACPVRTGRRGRRQRGRGARMALAGAASGDHPWRPRRELPRRGRTLRRARPAVEAVDTTGAGDVFAGVLAAGWLGGHEDALRRACAAGALSTLVPGAGDCAPYAEAIDDAVSNRRAGERHL